MGLLHYRGEGTPINYDQAFHFFQKSAKTDSTEGCYYLGQMYLRGQGVAKDLESAVIWLKKSEQMGHPHARASLNALWNGASSDNGKGGTVDRVISDLRTLSPELLMPLEELKSLRWIENKTLLGLAALGLFPLTAMAVFSMILPISTGHLLFYFSAIWGLFMHRILSTPQTNTKWAVACFLERE
ncbi:MAG: sel1 repeat family protein [Blastochloris sp.]|nr:sel1 repeat family protein [Blastochloris sp.]